MTELDLTALRKIAENEETQKWGKWAVEEGDDFDGFCVYINDGDNFGRSYVAKDMHQGESEGESTAGFIATFDPPTVLELLDGMESQRQVVKTLSVRNTDLTEQMRILQNRFDGMRAGRDSERSRADKNANALEKAEAQVKRVRELANEWEAGAMRWQDPLPVPREVSLIRDALGIQTHNPDLGDSMYGEDASCSCGYNGTPKGCWQSRRALDGEHTKQLGGTPTGELADVCSCGKSYWPCDSLAGEPNE